MTNPFSRLRLLVLLVGVALNGVLTRQAKADPAFVYINANPTQAQNAVSALQVVTGVAVAVAGSPFATGGLGLSPAPGADFTHRIVIAPTRSLLFASNDGSGSIAGFTINPVTGVLTPVPGSPFSVGSWGPFSGISLAISRDGRFLYASGKTIISLAVADNGALSEIGARWGFQERVAGIAIDPDNARLFLGMASGIVVLHASSAGLTADSPDILSIGSTSTDLALSSNGKHFWVTTNVGGIQAYNYDPGAFTIVPGSPFLSGVSTLGGVVADPSDRFLIAYSPSIPRLLSARLNTTNASIGASVALSPASKPLSAALSPAGAALFTADGSGQLDAWNAAPDGTLSHVAGFPTLTGLAPGFPSVATLAAQAPVPSAPAPMIWGLFALLLGAGAVVARRSRCSVSGVR